LRSACAKGDPAATRSSAAGTGRASRILEHIAAEFLEQIDAPAFQRPPPPAAQESTSRMVATSAVLFRVLCILVEVVGSSPGIVELEHHKT
jgi:hypothetical protein